VDLVLANSTGCILSTVPPLYNCLDLTTENNEVLRYLAKERGCRSLTWCRRS
jgi:hypothetical protein